MREPFVPILTAGCVAVILAHLEGSVAAAAQAADWLFAERDSSLLADVNPLPAIEQGRFDAVEGSVDSRAGERVDGDASGPGSMQLSAIGLEPNAQG